MSLSANRFEQGLYLLDEPEAALSPQRQLSFLTIIHDLATPGHAQFLIAAHSPLILSYPGGVLFTLDGDAIREIDYRELALTLLRHVRAARITVTAVVGDAEFGNNATLRQALHRAKLPYALGVSADVKVFLGTPRLQAPPSPTGTDRPRTRPTLPSDTTTVEARVWATAQPARAWRLVSWRNGTQPAWRARFCAVRVTPAHDWRERRLAPEVWLLCERDLGETPRTKHYLVDLPASAPLRALVRLAHQRWAIEQQYQELKDELGLDHVEGRTLPGWERHVVLTALAYSFLQTERQRRRQTHLTLPRVRAVVQEILTAHFFITQPHYLKWMLQLKDVELPN